MNSFSDVGLTSVNLEMLIETGKNHLIDRLSPIDLQFADISIQRINSNQVSSKNMIAIISFQYKEKAFQMIPLLLDGTIILSSNE